jgi:DNA polymerase I-like protein with 3'-5' exonuclease and polymerase domains
MHKAMSFEEAERTYGRGRIRRAYTYKALNKLIQGSAADMTKKAMLDLYKEENHTTYTNTRRIRYINSIG